MSYCRRKLLACLIVTAAIILVSGVTPIAAQQDPKQQAEALFQAGQQMYQEGQVQEALAKFEAALPLYQKVNDQRGEAQCLVAVGAAKTQLADYAGALTAFNASLAIWQKLGDKQQEAATQSNIGEVYRAQSQYKEALGQFQAALVTQKQINDQAGEGLTLANIGSVYDLMGQSEDALVQYRQALSIQRQIGDHAGEAKTLNSMGAAYLSLGRYQDALEQLQPSLSIRQQLNDLAGKLEVLDNIGYAHDAQGRHAEALKYYQQALAIAQQIHDRASEASISNDIAVAYRGQGRYTEALQNYQQALTIMQAINDRASESVVLENIGRVNHAQGHYTEALQRYQQALEIARAIGISDIEGSVLNNIGAVYDAQGRYTEALQYYQQALDIEQRIGQQEDTAATLLNMGGVNANLGRSEDALQQIQLALDIQRKIGDREGEERSINSIGAVYDRLGRYDDALSQFQQALAIQREIGDRGAELVTLSNIGELYHDQGRYSDALQQYQQALSVAQAVGERDRESLTLTNIGAVYIDLKQYQEAQNHLQQALDIQRQVGGREGEIRTLNKMGDLYRQQGHVAEALTSYTQAITTVEDIRGAIKVEELASSFASRQAPLYEQLINLLVDTGDVRAAFNYTERARARSFLTLLGNQPIDLHQGAAGDLVRQEQALRQQIVDLENSLRTARAKPIDQQDQSTIDRLMADREKLDKNYQDLVEKLKLANPEYVSLVSIDTLTLPDVQQQVLDDQTSMIVYFVTDKRTLAWVIDHQSVQFVPLNITATDLTNKITFLRSLIASHNFDPQVAADLYQTLFVPLRPYIRRPNLLIVPHRALHYLPFASLWDAERGRFLIEEYPIATAPSASSLRFILQKRNQNDGRLLALGNPDGSLPHAATEVESIAQIYGSTPLLGRTATESQVVAQAGQVDLLHLAAHGVYNPFNPLFTHIELAGDAKADGNLEVHEIFKMDLSGVNLVVLSACNSALGQQNDGDEIVGLNRAFLSAGAPAVVTSLWQIDDDASGALMTVFYRHLHEGQTTTAALRAAQAEIRSRKEYADPYYWAGFVLTGSPDVPATSPVSILFPMRTLWPAGLVVAVLACLLLIWQFRWRRSSKRSRLKGFPSNTTSTADVNMNNSSSHNLGRGQSQGQTSVNPPKIADSALLERLLDIDRSKDEPH